MGSCFGAARRRWGRRFASGGWRLGGVQVEDELQALPKLHVKCLSATIAFSFDSSIQIPQLISVLTVKFRVNSFFLICCSQVVFGDVNFTSIFHHLLEMLLESHLRLTMSVLCCFSLDVLRLTGAAPTIERSVTTEQCPGRRLQIPQIFLHTSDSHLCLNCFSDQPNDAEVNTATAKRLYTCCITYYYTFMSIH